MFLQVSTYRKLYAFTIYITFNTFTTHDKKSSWEHSDKNKNLSTDVITSLKYSKEALCIHKIGYITFIHTQIKIWKIKPWKMTGIFMRSFRQKQIKIVCFKTFKKTLLILNRSNRIQYFVPTARSIISKRATTHNQQFKNFFLVKLQTVTLWGLCRVVSNSLSMGHGRSFKGFIFAVIDYCWVKISSSLFVHFFNSQVTIWMSSEFGHFKQVKSFYHHSTYLSNCSRLGQNIGWDNINRTKNFEVAHWPNSIRTRDSSITYPTVLLP